MKLVLVVVTLGVVLQGVVCGVAQCDSNATDREDCGYSGIDEDECEGKGCCWEPVSPNPNNEPWCFYPPNFAPPPPPPPSPPSENCNNDGYRVDCGYSGITESECEAKGCCWNELDDNPNNLPWCFAPNMNLPPAPQTPVPPPGTPPFSAEEVETMMGYFMANLNVDDSGAVVAAPDTTTPGGSYYYHWMRDGALSMRALMITNNDTSIVDYHMTKYTEWVLGVQGEVDPNNIDVRIEPKFEIPSGDPYTGGWCRPQTDGPGLRAGTLSLYALYLINHGGVGFVKDYLYTNNPSDARRGGAIYYDLEWVNANWTSAGCDLWEEVTSADLFWNRYNFRYGLEVGAQVADVMGDNATASRWRATAQEIQSTLPAHYNGDYVYESTNRLMDSAVIIAFNDGYLNDGFFAPNSEEVSGTIATLNDVFYSTFPINAIDDQIGLPGILYGRYPGDVYAGGNPWILNTAALAHLYYNGAVETLRTRRLPGPKALENFRRAGVTLPRNPTYRDFARAVVQEGDNIMYRIRHHVEPYDFHLSEQIDKNTGDEIAASDLTWSYAEVLLAMYYRENAQSGLI
mmetsp:Transcript_33419/g.93798  ORF Transcript_33419/g.93798 Transcript_33419/m.93798 type:complete len:571 (+) Transcript_33419:58-1770(+)